jgi:hypothetical protein
MSFPKIDSPCPLRFGALPEPGRDYCTRCERRVHNLDALSAPARRAFLAACDGPVCVAYTRPVSRALGSAIAAAGVTALLSGAPAGADELSVEGIPVTEASDAKGPCPIDPDGVDEISIIVGGVLSPADARWEEEPAGELPEIPRAPASEMLEPEEIAAFVAPPRSLQG